MLPLPGKDEARIRGNPAARHAGERRLALPLDRVGGRRSRSLTELLASFPDPDPGRAFAAGRCVHAVLRGPAAPIEIPRGRRRTRSAAAPSLWEVLMERCRRRRRYAGLLLPPARRPLRRHSHPPRGPPRVPPPNRCLLHPPRRRCARRRFCFRRALSWSGSGYTNRRLRSSSTVTARMITAPMMACCR